MAKATPEEQLAFGLSLVDLAHRWRKAVDEELRPLGFSQSTWRTLFYVSRAGGEIGQKDLAINIGIEGPSLVHLLDSLEDAGMIVREISSSDRRAKAVKLTGAVRSEMMEIEAILDRVRSTLLDGLDKDQLAACATIFERIKENAIAHEEPKTHKKAAAS